MYRIRQYGNGRFFVQKHGRYGWFQIGPTYNRFSSAESAIERDKIRWSPCYRPEARTVAYR